MQREDVFDFLKKPLQNPLLTWIITTDFQVPLHSSGSAATSVVSVFRSFRCVNVGARVGGMLCICSVGFGYLATIPVKCFLMAILAGLSGEMLVQTIRLRGLRRFRTGVLWLCAARRWNLRIGRDPKKGLQAGNPRVL
jgi:hypothetical protein